MQTKIRGLMVLATASICGSLARPAAAGTYSCDNDRAASQYPNCTNTLLSGWSYRTGTGADWNGDDRLSGSGVTNSYFWNFSGLSGGNTLQLQVWLANAAFTDPSALYIIWLGNTGYFKFINQNTAPSGWNAIRQAPSSSSPQVELNPSGQSSARAGADIIQLKTLQTLTAQSQIPAEVISDPERCGVSHPTDTRILAIQQRMWNSIDNYRDVKGTYHVAFQNNGQDEDVEFEISEGMPGSHVKTSSRSGGVLEYRSNGRVLAAMDGAGQVVRASEVGVVTPLGGLRHYHNDQCEPVFVHRQDPAAAHAASDVAFPQNYAFWLSDSEAWIVGTDKVAGRAVTVIEGRQDPYLEAKLGATTFRMWVDDATGALLKLLGTDAGGAVVYSVEVKGIQFDRGVDASHFAVTAAGLAPSP